MLGGNHLEYVRESNEHVHLKLTESYISIIYQ